MIFLCRDTLSINKPLNLLSLTNYIRIKTILFHQKLVSTGPMTFSPNNRHNKSFDQDITPSDDVKVTAF